MKILLFTYDLKRPPQSYMALFAVLKSASAWWHYLESTWLLATPLSPKEWSKKLDRLIYPNDKMLIIEVKPNYSGWLSRDAWKWIKENLKMRQ